MGKVTHAHTHLKVRGLDCKVEGVQWFLSLGTGAGGLMLWGGGGGDSQPEQAVWWGMGSVMEALWFKERKDMGAVKPTEVSH